MTRARRRVHCRTRLGACAAHENDRRGERSQVCWCKAGFVDRRRTQIKDRQRFAIELELIDDIDGAVEPVVGQECGQAVPRAADSHIGAEPAQWVERQLGLRGSNSQGWK